MLLRDIPFEPVSNASGIEIGSASIQCPWNVQPILDEARRLFR